jgi:hypothetical protein
MADADRAAIKERCRPDSHESKKVRLGPLPGLQVKGRLGRGSGGLIPARIDWRGLHETLQCPGQRG